jgi:hypothetical protein
MAISPAAGLEESALAGLPHVGAAADRWDLSPPARAGFFALDQRQRFGGSGELAPCDVQDVRDVDEAIWRVRQAQHLGDQLTEDELLQAAELLGSDLGRRDAAEAAAIALQWLSAADDNDPHADAASPSPAVTPSLNGRERESSVAGHVRTVGAVVLAATAVILWFAMAPGGVQDRSPNVNQALSDYALNEGRTQGAPQQQVVNGWVAKDLLTVLARQANDSARAAQQASDRLAAEAILVVVAVAFGIAIRPFAGGRPA